MPVSRTGTRQAKSCFVGPLFIVGLPRSGTKLLRALLNAHSQIRILSIETEFLPYWVKNWDRYGDLSDREKFQRFYEKMTRMPYFVYLQQRDDLVKVDDWYAACQTFTPGGVFEALARHGTGAEPGSDMVWGDKSPSYVRHLPVLKSIYPNARVIHIIRDVRDYCLSVRRAWRKNMFRAAQRWTDDVSNARAQGQAMGQDYLELRYEDLLGDPENQLALVCHFLDREFEPGMCRLKGAVENLGATVGRSEIVRDNAGKWRNELGIRQRWKIERIACETLKACGYEVSKGIEPRRIPRASMAVYKFLDGVNLVRTNREFRPHVAVRFYWNYRKITSV